MATSRICSIPDCGKVVACRGWCSGHYQRWQVHGDPLLGKPTPHAKYLGPCTVSGCGKKVIARGWCLSHYSRWINNGDPLGGRIPHGETQRFYEVSVRSFVGQDCLIWPYGRSVSGYGLAVVDGKGRYVHRLACAHINGPPPTPKHQAAHSCGNGHLGCCNPRHLRWATTKENSKDRELHGTLLKSGWRKT